MAVDLDNGLVGYWPMNEGHGTTSTEDESTNSNNGTLHNIDNSNWVNGKSGTALKLNGTDEYINCGDDTSLDMGVGDFTVSFWAKVDAYSIRDIFVSKYQGSHIGFYISLGPDPPYNRIHFKYGAGVARKITSDSTIELDRWYFIVVVHENGGKDYIYIDSVEDKSATSYNDNVNTTADFKIGWRYGVDFINGTIDEVRFYNRKLNTDEIDMLYSNPYGTQTDITTYKIIVTDLDGSDHIITDDLHNVDVGIVSSSAADTFSFDITNIDDVYSYIERGCEIRILTGIDGANEFKITGLITEVIKQLEGQLVIPVMSVSGEDVESRLKKIKFSKRYYDIEISALVKAILDDTDFSTGKTYRELADVSSDYAYIEATAYSVEIASYNWKSMSSAFAELAESVGFEWYIDTDKRLHFYDSASVAISSTLTDDDLHGNPVINDIGEIVNRAIVIGGYHEVTDQSGSTQTTTFKVTNAISKNESFVPTEDYLNSVFVYTKLETGSQSGIEISIQADSAAAPDGINLANGKYTLPLDSIVDGGYSEFKFDNVVTLTPGETYWIVLDGTTTDGQLIGVDGSGDVDFETKSPVRVAVIANDDDSQDMYGMYIAPVYRDENLIDPDLAELKANQMLNGTPKRSANIVIHGTDVTANDVVTLTISKVGVAINKTMKVIKSSQTLDHLYIINNLELEEI